MWIEWGAGKNATSFSGTSIGFHSFTLECLKSSAIACTFYVLVSHIRQVNTQCILCSISVCVFVCVSLCICDLVYLVSSCPYSGRVGHFPGDLCFLKHTCLKETGEVASQPCWCGCREDPGQTHVWERGSMKTFFPTPVPTLCLQLSPSFCDYHSHNEKLSLECQYLQGTLAAAVEGAVPTPSIIVNKEEKKPFKFVKRKESACSRCWALAKSPGNK